MLTAQRMGAILDAVDALVDAGALTWAAAGVAAEDIGADGMPADWSAELAQMTPAQRTELNERLVGVDAEWAVPLRG